MESSPPLTTCEGTKKDFQESWKLLKANYRAFLGTFLFAIGAAALTIIFILSLLRISQTELTMSFSDGWIFSTQHRWIAFSLGYLILITFINCQTGLAHDIMSSGEMFAEFKSSFSYFKQHWWKYIIFSIFLGGFQIFITLRPPWYYIQDPPSIPEGSGNPLDFLTPTQLIIISFTLVIFFLINFFWVSIFNQTLASINAQGNFFRAIKESVIIFKTNPKRVLSTWGLYFIFFLIPSLLIESIMMLFSECLHEWIFLFSIILIIWYSIVIFIGLPLRALLITGLYNNIKKDEE
jgi:hypothetical protein